MNYLVFNLATAKEFAYTNDIGAIQNLINTYLIEQYGAMSLYNTNLRLEVAKRVITTQRGFGLGDYAILKERKTNVVH